MINTFSQKYLSLLKEHKEQQWENYFENGSYDLGLIDKKIYNLALEYKDMMNSDDNESQQAKKIILRDLVDKNKEVSDLRNYIDSLDNYAASLAKNLPKGSYQYKLALAKLMKPDVLELMKKRNKHAQKLKFDSYPDLVLALADTNICKIKGVLQEFLDINLREAQSIIAKYGLNLETWFSDLDKLGITHTQYDSVALTRDFFKMLGYSEIPKELNIHYIIGGFSGFTTEITPDDIRIALGPISSLNHIRTLFHELGHAVNYLSNKKQGLFRILTPDKDEPVAVYYEYMASHKLLNSEDEIKVKELLTLEYTRCAISALFEFELWENPETAEDLFLEHYQKLGLRIIDPAIWAYDSFRSIDPVYIHNYVLGAIKWLY